VVALLAGRCRTLKGRCPDDHIRLVAYTSDQARDARVEDYGGREVYYIPVHVLILVDRQVMRGVRERVRDRGE